MKSSDFYLRFIRQLLVIGFTPASQTDVCERIQGHPEIFVIATQQNIPQVSLFLYFIKPFSRAKHKEQYMNSHEQNTTRCAGGKGRHGEKREKRSGRAQVQAKLKKKTEEKEKKTRKGRNNKEDKHQERCSLQQKKRKDKSVTECQEKEGKEGCERRKERNLILNCLRDSA